jgi:hypothetical protein
VEPGVKTTSVEAGQTFRAGVGVGVGIGVAFVFANCDAIDMAISATNLRMWVDAVDEIAYLGV